MGDVHGLQYVIALQKGSIHADLALRLLAIVKLNVRCTSKFDIQMSILKAFLFSVLFNAVSPFSRFHNAERSCAHEKGGSVGR